MMTGSRTILNIGLATAVLTLDGGSRADLLPTPVPLMAVADQRTANDLSARLLLVGGDGCPCLTLKFTNLGPGPSPSFAYQISQQKLVGKSYGAARMLNSLAEGAVPGLPLTGTWQKLHWLVLEHGAKYRFKVVYSPVLNDLNNSNHNVEITYQVP